MAGRVTLLTILVATLAGASRADDRDAGGFRFGGAALFGAPRGEFDRNVGDGWGLAGHVLWLPGGGPLGLRADGSALIYGSETLHTAFRGTSGRVGLAVRTDNWIASLTAGPEIAARSGRVRPYVHAFAGVSYFSTTSELLGPDEFSVLVTTTNFDDATFAYGAGGGLRVPLGSGSWALDAGVRFLGNDRVRYLAEGDLVDDGRGGVRFTPRSSRGDTLEFRLGLTLVR